MFPDGDSGKVKVYKLLIVYVQAHIILLFSSKGMFYFLF